jgi:hypothetical protein
MGAPHRDFGWRCAESLRQQGLPPRALLQPIEEGAIGNCMTEDDGIVDCAIEDNAND